MSDHDTRAADEQPGGHVDMLCRDEPHLSAEANMEQL